MSFPLGSEVLLLYIYIIYIYIFTYTYSFVHIDIFKYTHSIVCIGETKNIDMILYVVIFRLWAKIRIHHANQFREFFGGSC